MGYGWPAIKQLAIRNPLQASHNADTYAFFAVFASLLTNRWHWPAEAKKHLQEFSLTGFDTPTPDLKTQYKIVGEINLLTHSRARPLPDYEVGEPVSISAEAMKLPSAAMAKAKIRRSTSTSGAGRISNSFMWLSSFTRR